MKFVVFVLLVLVSVAAAQYHGFGSDVFGSFDSQGFAPLAAVRDPRQNTGPVVFPPSPPGNPADTSGVVVGASGYGFVPPAANQGVYRYHRYHHHRFYF